MRIRAEGRRRGLRLASPTLLFSLSVLAFVVQAACGSDDGKKTAPKPYPGTGGEGGENAGGTAGTAGSSGSAGNGGSAISGNGGSSNGGEPTTTAGVDGGGTDGGTANDAGAGGEAGTPGTQCAPGTADCDNDPSDCETDATQLNNCGACGVTCSQTNGVSICGADGCEVSSCTTGFADCNDSGEDGCEASLTTSTSCGLCGHDCAGAACTNGLCAGTSLGSAAAAYRWASTSDAIYRFSCNTPGYGVSASYALIRTPLSGAAEVQMAADSKGAGGLAVDDQFVYWAVQGTPSAVFKKAHGAAAATVPTAMFEPTSLPVQLSIQGGTMYWTALDGQIYKRALSAAITDTGTLVLDATQVKGSGVFNLHYAFLTTPTRMYWVVAPATGNLASIRTAKLDGSEVADVPGAITNAWLKPWVSGEDLYYVRATGAALDGAYHYAPGGSIEALAIQTNLVAIMTSGNYFYVSQNNDVYRGPIAGGDTTKVSAGGGLLTLNGFATSDAKYVYGVTAFTQGSGFWPANKMAAFPR